MRKILTLKFFFPFFLLFFFSNCNHKKSLSSINDNFSFPTDMVTLKANNTDYLLMLNSTMDEKYKDGSLVLVSAENAIEKKVVNSFSIPKKGNDLAVSEDGRLIAVSFCCSPKQEIRFYDYSDVNNPFELTSLRLSFAEKYQTIGKLTFFKPKSAAAENKYLYGIAGHPLDISSKVFIVEITNTSAKIIFNLPDDLPVNDKSLFPGNNSPTYRFGLGAPSFLADEEYLVVFPQGMSKGTKEGTALPPVPIASDYFKGNLKYQKEKGLLETDLRAVSMAVVDLKSFLEFRNLNYSTFHIPLAWDNLGRPWNAKNFSSDNFYFQNTFSQSTSISQLSHECDFKSLNGNSKISNSAILVAKSGSSINDQAGDVFKIEGFEEIKKEIDQKLAEEKSDEFSKNFNEEKRVLGRIEQLGTPPNVKIKPSVFSRVKDVKVFDNNILSVGQFHLIKTNSKCVPVWSRTTSYTASAGLDRSWIVTHGLNQPEGDTYADFSVDPMKAAAKKIPGIGTYSCSVAKVNLEEKVFCINYNSNRMTGFSLKADDGLTSFEWEEVK